MLINGLPVPPRLIDLMLSGRWRIPAGADAKAWERFLNHGLSFDRDPRVRLFDLDAMVARSTGLSRQRFPLKLDPISGLSIVHTLTPLDYDPGRSVVIADLCSFTDRPDDLVVPIVLDYRPGMWNPRVICYPDDPYDLYWCEVAPTFDEFVERLGL